MTPRLCYLLAGLETGVFGGMLGLGWTVISSLWQGRPLWTEAALLGSVADENMVWRREFWLAALSGAALALFIAGLLGALFGMIVRRAKDSLRTMLAGIIFGFATFLLCNAAMGGRWQWAGNPAAHERTMFVACLLFGAFLGQYPRLLRSISATFFTEG